MRLSRGWMIVIAVVIAVIAVGWLGASGFFTTAGG